MKITDIQIDSFGHWSGLNAPEISPGVTVIYGPNEAGKSTILHLVRGILYGYSPDHHARFVPPRHGGDVGGRLTVTGPHGRYVIRRWLPGNDPLGKRANHDVQAGDLEIRTAAGAVQGKHLLGTLLSGVDDAIFRNVFAVGLSEMQHLATLSDTEAAQQLYGLASGSDRVSITDVAQQLAESRHTLLAADDLDSITQLTLQRDQLRREAQADQSLTQRWLKLMDAHTEVTASIEKLQQQQQRYGQPLHQDANRKAVREKFREARTLHQKLKQMGKFPDIPADVIQRIEATQQLIRKHRKDWERLRDQRRKLHEKGKQLDVSAALLHYAEPITQLQQRGPWITNLVGQVSQLKSRVDETEFELQGEFERVGLLSGARFDSIPMVTDDMVRELNEPARQIVLAREQATAAERSIEESRRDVQQLTRELVEPLRKTGHSDLTTAWKKQEQHAQALRQRINLENELESSERKVKETRGELKEWTEKELLPWRGLMILGGLFSLGTVLMLAGLCGRYISVSDHQRITMGLIGGAMAAASLVMRALIEFAAGSSANACREELNQLQKKRQRLVKEAQQLEPHLPASTEPLGLRLQHAQAQLESMTLLQPLERQRVAAEKRLQQAELQKADAEKLDADARRLWREKLLEFGLPDSVTPNQFREISQPGAKVSQIRARYSESHRDHEEKKTELDAIRERLDAIFERTTLVPEGDRLEQQIEQLGKALKATRENHRQREALRRKWRDAGREQDRFAEEAKKLQLRRQQMVARFGVGDAQELKTTVKRRKEAEQLKRKRDKRLRELAEQLGPCCRLSTLQQGVQHGNFEKKLVAWEKEYDQLTKQLNHQLEHRGELGQQIKQLTSQRQHLQIRLQLDECDAQLEHQVQAWQRLAATSLALDSVRQSYESDRQPETLAEASGYLKQLTDGRYGRIWTPCGESSLYVDDRAAKPIPVEHLSRGTREQVFLALRMALAAAYGRRGSAMPLILDDVFVNFDKQRATAAARTVCEFANAGYQVLVFTCHEHIRDVFFDLGVDLRELPPADAIAETHAPVLPTTQIDRPAEIPHDPVAQPVTLAPEVPVPAISAPAMPMPVETRELRPAVDRPVTSVIPIVDYISPEPTSGNGSEAAVTAEQSFREAPLPELDDPELDHELTYGAPQFDPGFGAPEWLDAVDVEPPATEEPQRGSKVARRRKRRNGRRRPASDRRVESDPYDDYIDFANRPQAYLPQGYVPHEYVRGTQAWTPVAPNTGIAHPDYRPVMYGASGYPANGHYGDIGHQPPSPATRPIIHSLAYYPAGYPAGYRAERTYEHPHDGDVWYEE